MHYKNFFHANAKLALINLNSVHINFSYRVIFQEGKYITREKDI